MPQTQILPLPSPAPGTARSLAVHRFGTVGARPKAYLQAALHADELPGVLVLQHVMGALEAAERDGTLRGEVVIVPCANPVGLAQHVHGALLGRYALDATGNFNRGFVELRQPLLEAVAGRLGGDAGANVALIRDTLAGLLARRQPREEGACLKLALQRLAVDADIALDLHCDAQAALHLYLGPKLWPEAADLAAELGAAAVLLCADSGDCAFDEALGRPWWHLIDHSPGTPIPAAACLTGTVELRGRHDIDDQTARADAAGLLRFLQRRGVLAGAPPPLPPLRCAPTPLEGVDVVVAPAAGLLVHRRAPGERVSPGDLVAELVDPLDPAGGRVPLAGRVDGVMFARQPPGMVRAGDWVAKIAGPTPLADRDRPLLGD